MSADPVAAGGQGAGASQGAGTSQVRSIRLVRWTAVVACCFGAIVLGVEFARYLIVFPAASLLAVALELPLLVLGFLVLRAVRPLRSPPLIWSAAALVWGATAAAGCALLANQGLASLWAKSAGSSFASSWSAALSAPLNEEILKLCGVVMVVLAAPQTISGPLGGWIYGALTGLGFQVVENVTYGLNNIGLTGGTDPVRSVAQSAAIRIGQAGLGSHWTMTAVAGTAVGFVVVRIRGGTRGGALPALACLAGAIAMHLLFDAPFLPLAIKVALNFLAAFGLYLVLVNGYLSRMHDLVAARVADGQLTDAEAAGVLSRRRRRRDWQQTPPGEQRELLRSRQERLLAELDVQAE